MYVRSCNCQLYIRTFIYIVFTYVRTLNTTIRTKQMITIHYIQKLVYMTCYLTTAWNNLPLLLFALPLARDNCILNKIDRLINWWYLTRPHTKLPSIMSQDNNYYQGNKGNIFWTCKWHFYPAFINFIFLLLWLAELLEYLDSHKPEEWSLSQFLLLYRDKILTAPPVYDD